MKKTILLSVLAALCLFQNAASQPGKYQPLKVGDPMLDISFTNLLNYPKSQLRLSECEGKLLIIDFWATWCTACLANADRLDSLQDQYKDRMLILSVTKEPEKKIRSFFERRKLSSPASAQFATVTGDTVLNQLFPHRYIPHYVWINEQGIVQAITGSEEVSEENIRKYFGSGGDRLRPKTDIDTDRPLFLSENYPDNNPLLFYSLLTKGVYDGLPSGTHFKRKGAVVYGRSFTNLPLLAMYEAAARQLFTEMGDHYYSKNRLTLRVDDPQHLTGKDAAGRYDRTNQYNYELIVPPGQADSLYRYLIQDLNRYSAYTGVISRQQQECWVLSRINDRKPPMSTGGEPNSTLADGQAGIMQNYPLSVLVTALNSSKQISLPVLDETRWDAPVDLRLSGDMDFKHLNRDLQPYGLQLIKARRLIAMLVITEKQSSRQSQHRSFNSP